MNSQPSATDNAVKTGMRVGRAASALLLASLIGDIAARAVPPGWIAFRSWEAADLLPTREGGFTPNFSYDNPAAYGDLANMANLQGMREYRRERFTTDSRGFRNPDSTAFASPPNVVLMGDSFAAGAGVDDSDTLAEQIRRITGVPVYNAGHFSSRTSRILSLLDRLGVRNGTVIVELSETFSVPDWPEQPNQAERIRAVMERVLPAEQAEQASNYARCLRNLLDYAPLRIVTKRAVRSLWDDRLLPNVEAKNAAVRELKNGKQMLFLPATILKYETPEAPDPRWVLELNKLMAARGHRLMVLLVPDKYTVYAPLLRHARATPPGAGSYLYQLDARLREANLRSVNLAPVFRDRAGEALANNQYLYWGDDTHWNPAGIGIAAELVAADLRALPRSYPKK